MANIFSDLRGAVQTLMGDTWDDVTVLFNVQEAGRMNWRYMVEQFERSIENGLEPPWGVLQPGQWTQEEFGCNTDSYIVNYSLWYITSLSDEDGLAKTTEVYLAEVEQAMADMNAALRGYTGTTFQTFESNYDLSDGNPANKYFNGMNAPFYAGVLDARLIAGNAGS